MSNPSVKACNQQSPRSSCQLGAEGRVTSKPETDCADALANLFFLLEDYAPPWYTGQLHEQTEKVLRTAGRL